MSTLAITGTAVDTSGASTPFTGSITVIDPPAINSVVVSPASAVAGTLRTITINATDPQGQTLSYTCKVNGINATPTGQPNVFTYVA